MCISRVLSLTRGTLLGACISFVTLARSRSEGQGARRGLTLAQGSNP